MKGYEKFDLSFVEQAFSEAFFMWLEYKKERKEKYKTQKSLELCYKHLKVKADSDPQTALAVVEQSMANNWAGLFELKNGKQVSNYTARNTAEDKRRDLDNLKELSRQILRSNQSCFGG